MRVLVAIKSCARDHQNGCHSAILDSWGRDVAQHSDVVFFTGQDLGIDDSYQGLAVKTKKILEWSLQRGYDFTILSDNDTFIVPNRLQGFEEHDYSGKIAQNREEGNKYWFCHGGFGYFVSRRLAEMVVKVEPKITDEDRFVGQVAHDNGIVPVEKVVGFHYPKSMYSVRYHPCTEWQKLMYKKFCLGESVEVHSEDVPRRVIKSGEVLVRMKDRGRIVVVSPSVARRLVFRGLAHAI